MTTDATTFIQFLPAIITGVFGLGGVSITLLVSGRRLNEQQRAQERLLSKQHERQVQLQLEQFQRDRAVSKSETEREKAEQVLSRSIDLASEFLALRERLDSIDSVSAVRRELSVVMKSPELLQRLCRHYFTGSPDLSELIRTYSDRQAEYIGRLHPLHMARQNRVTPEQVAEIGWNGDDFARMYRAVVEEREQFLEQITDKLGEYLRFNDFRQRDVRQVEAEKE